MNNLYKLVTLLLILSSCGSDTENLNKIKEKIHTKDCKDLMQSGDIWTLNGKPFTGYCEDNTSGVIISSGTFKDGYLDGKTTFNYPNGQPHEMIEYKNGVPHGNVEYYYDNGQLSTVGTVKEGLKHGVWKTYYANGFLSEVTYWENDIPVDSILSFFANGNPYYKGVYKNGEQDGRWEKYDSLSGNLIQYYYYKNGELSKIDSLDLSTTKANPS